MKNWKWSDFFVFIVCEIIGIWIWYVDFEYLKLIELIKLNYEFITLLALAIVFIIAPFYSHIKIGNFVELDRKIEDFKKEIRQSFQNLQTIIMQINLKQNVNVNIVKDVHQIAEELKSEIGKEQIDTENELTNIIRYAENDPKYAFILLIINIEKSLRELYEALINKGETKDGIRIMAEYLKHNERVDGKLYNSVIQLNELRNIAIHGGDVDINTLREFVPTAEYVLRRIKKIFDSLNK